MSELDKHLSNINSKNLKQTNFASIVSELIEKTHQRSLIIIFSDMMNFDTAYQDNLFESLQHLRYRKNEVILFHVQALTTEKSFKFSNKGFS